MERPRFLIRLRCRRIVRKENATLKRVVREFNRVRSFFALNEADRRELNRFISQGLVLIEKRHNFWGNRLRTTAIVLKRKAKKEA